jgi:hypothetical protein
MSHHKGKKAARLDREEAQFKKDALRIARRNLSKAIEWIDHKDVTWAIVMTQRALTLLEAARKV